MCDCLVLMDNFIGCWKDTNQVQESCPTPNAPTKNLFCALHNRGDQEYSPDVVTDIYKNFPLMSMLY